MTFDAFLAIAGTHRDLWAGLYRIARLPGWAEGATPGRKLRLLVLAEDWCGDASNSIPFLAKWAEQTPGVELRIIRRDQHPLVMDRYLTRGSRSIPIVIVLDEDFLELGHWGPRPGVLQEWVLQNKGSVPKAELYPQIRKWYARDRGETTLKELLEIAGIRLPA
ncbi:MAG: thioredoxin family protein [Gemmatimonadota bacterium]